MYYGNGSGNFTMNSGTISGNSANNGGGVFIARTFDMKGGEISENKVVVQFIMAVMGAST